MEAGQVRGTDDLLALLEHSGAEHVTVALSDFQGQLRGKLVSRERVAAALAGGYALPAGMLALDPGDAMLAAAGLSDGGDGYRDAPAHLLPDTVRRLPWADPARDLLLLAEYAGDAAACCPRAVYRRVMAQALERGLVPWHGVELEWTLFEESPWSARDKRYRDLRPATPMSTHGVLVRQGARARYYDALLDACRVLRIPIESAHEEIGEGMMEAALAHGPGVAIADRAVLLKLAAKVLARRHDQLACFMARWDDDHDGHGQHVHLSLRNPAGEALFHAPAAAPGMNAAMRHSLGGMQRWLPELMLMCAPNVNSFKRFTPRGFAPVASVWGIDNRTCALRAIPGPAEHARIECRVPGADANPYLALAALVAAAVRGVAEAVEPGPPVDGDAYDAPIAPELAFPATFAEAIERFRTSAFARATFGEAFVAAYAATRAAQERELRGRVTDVELARFFELV